MTGNEIAERAFALKRSLEESSGESRTGDFQLQLTTLIAELAKQVSILDRSQRVQFQTTAEGETI
ncbi:hypothetical protein ACLBWX_22325 [Methylobacterium sp. M6A4_1b]